MLTVEFCLVEIDLCSACGGVWLDSGELLLIAERADAHHSPLVSALERGTREKRGPSPHHRCPVCAKQLRNVCAPKLPTVCAGRCEHRHGLWFDGGQLEAVVRAAGAGPENEFVRFLAELGERRREGTPSGQPGS